MRLALLCALALLLFSPNVAVGQTASPDLAAQRIAQIFTAPHVSPDWFSSGFLKQIPAAKIDEIVGQLKFALGTFKSVTKSTEKNEDQYPAPWIRYLAKFKDGTDDVYIHVNESGKIDGLAFRTPHTTF